MGKNWKGRGGGGGRGGGSGGGNDLASCRGYAAIIGTCDAARERESTKELSNLLSQTIERLGLTTPPPTLEEEESADPSSKGNESIEDMLRNEVMQIKNQKRAGTQDFVSINTGIKGIVLVKIARRDLCPIMLVKSIFDQISSEKVPCSRHLVRVIPLQILFFAGEDDFTNITKLLLEGTFEKPDITLPKLQLSKVIHKRKTPEGEADVASECANVDEEGESGNSKRARIESCIEEIKTVQTAAEVVEVPKPEVVSDTPLAVEATSATSSVPHVMVKYMLMFKARNHNTLTKTFALNKFRELTPSFLRQDYLHATNVVIVEALKNVAGISYFSDYNNYADLNLRKHQTAVCPQVVSSHILAAATEKEDGVEKVIDSKESALAQSVESAESQSDA